MLLSWEEVSAAQLPACRTWQGCRGPKWVVSSGEMLLALSIFRDLETNYIALKSIEIPGMQPFILIV